MLVGLEYWHKMKHCGICQSCFTFCREKAQPHLQPLQNRHKSQPLLPLNRCVVSNIALYFVTVVQWDQFYFVIRYMSQVELLHAIFSKVSLQSSAQIKCDETGYYTADSNFTFWLGARGCLMQTFWAVRSFLALLKSFFLGWHTIKFVVEYCQLNWSVQKYSMVFSQDLLILIGFALDPPFDSQLLRENSKFLKPRWM